jgi:hypothetical protein
MPRLASNFPIMLTSRRHGGACPGHPRLVTKKDVDARDEAGHDGVWRYLFGNAPNCGNLLFSRVCSSKKTELFD